MVADVLTKGFRKGQRKGTRGGQGIRFRSICEVQHKGNCRSGKRERQAVNQVQVQKGATTEKATVDEASFRENEANESQWPEPADTSQYDTWQADGSSGNDRS